MKTAALLALAEDCDEPVERQLWWTTAGPQWQHSQSVDRLRSGEQRGAARAKESKKEERQERWPHHHHYCVWRPQISFQRPPPLDNGASEATLRRCLRRGMWGVHLVVVVHSQEP